MSSEMFKLLCLVLVNIMIELDAAPTPIKLVLPSLNNGDRIKVQGIMKHQRQNLKFIFYHKHPPKEQIIDVPDDLEPYLDGDNFSFEFLLNENDVQITSETTAELESLKRFKLTDVTHFGILGDLRKLLNLEIKFNNLVMPSKDS